MGLCLLEIIRNAACSIVNLFQFIVAGLEKTLLKTMFDRDGELCYNQQQLLLKFLSGMFAIVKFKNCIKPKSKSSKNNYLHSESRRLVRRWLQGYSEWTCEGSPKSKESRRLRGAGPL